jgi:hypothetical protein
MGRKYIKQIINQNFIYPNDNVAEYDVEIVHDINNNCVSGSVSNFSATTVSSTGITLSLNYTWLLNNAEAWIRNSNLLAFWSLHCIVPGQSFYKPWRLIQSRSSSNTALISNAEVGVLTTITPSQMGVSSFTNGTYYFELRMIGHRCIFPICLDLTISTIPTPTPTPTATGAPPTPTPTPTPTATGGVCCVSGVTLNVTDTGWIKYTLCDGTQEYKEYTTTGNKTIPECIQQNSVNYGFPFANLAEFTVTGAGTQCGGVCVTPTPTPTPTATVPGGLTAYGGCGRGNSVADSCNDAGINNRTFYSDCAPGSLGNGCYVYTDTVPNALIGFTNVFMSGANYDVNSATGVITGLSSVQC